MMAAKLFKVNFSTSSLTRSQLSLDNINQNIRKLEYAVRGPIVIRAAELEAELKRGEKKPFASIIKANIGDAQAMNQKPVTFIRQLLSCAADKSLLASSHLPNDVKQRVKELMASCGGQSVGAYTDSSGIEPIRRHIAEFIEKRDGGNSKVDYRNIFLSNGASDAIKCILSFLNQSRAKDGKPVGVMISKPQYPLYSATLCEFAMDQVYYTLDEDNDWSLDVNELRRVYDQHKDKSDIRALVVINPGNPTGSVLSEKNILEILAFANEHNLFILADEVYQHNIYEDDVKFVSFKKMLTHKTSYDLELASFMSTSKGYMGECGIRGGYCELHNMRDDVKAILYKGRSSWLCSNTLGQVCMDAVVKPPQPGEESFQLHEQEKTSILNELKRKAKLVAETFNSMDGIKCNRVSGAMYAFPRIDMPPKFIEKARKLNCQPDFLYAMEFLETQGVCIVPGSGFGQKEGSYHFRTTILPPQDIFEDMMSRFRRFHAEFLDKYS